MAAEMELSKVDNKTKVETTLQEQAAIRQENKEREQEREADLARANQAAAASAAETLRDTAPLVEGHKVRFVFFCCHQRGYVLHFLLQGRWWNVSLGLDNRESSVVLV